MQRLGLRYIQEANRKGTSMIRRAFLLILLSPFLLFFDYGLLYNQWKGEYRLVKEPIWQCYGPNRVDRNGVLIPKYVQVF